MQASNSISVNIPSALDLHPFGMPMPGCSYTSENYKFGFNGMEKDDEMKGEGNSLDFGARIYDSRLGPNGWLSVDPLQKKYPDVSPYVFAGGNPIYFKDPDGKAVFGYTDLLNNRGLFVAMRILDAADTYKSFLQQFASVNTGDNLGNSQNGSSSWLNIRFSTFENASDPAGQAQIMYKGVAINSYTASELEGVDASELEIHIKLNPNGNESGAKLLTASHETMLHGAQYADLITAYKNSDITIEQLYESYQDNAENQTHHKQITPGNELYEKTNDAIENTLQNNSRLNSVEQVSNEAVDYGAKKNSVNERLNEQGKATILQQFQGEREFEKNHSHNPEKAGQLLNVYDKED